MARRIGFIAEDVSDVEVLKILAKRMTSATLSISYFVGKGCGPLARKTPAWCRNFAQKGCNQILLVHDRDTADEGELRTKLEGILAGAPQTKKAVVIPVEELEAWLLSDESAIRIALGLTTAPKAISHPEMITSPKEHLSRIVHRAGAGKVYVNTVHNSRIASLSDISKIAKKCPSFAKFAAFIR